MICWFALEEHRQSAAFGILGRTMGEIIHHYAVRQTINFHSGKQHFHKRVDVIIQRVYRYCKQACMCAEKTIYNYRNNIMSITYLFIIQLQFM